MPQPPDALDDGAIHVWLARPDDVCGDASALATLTDDERVTFAQHRLARDRTSATAARILLRRMLSHYTRAGIAPYAWRFRSDPNGRPHAAIDVAVPVFSVSHTRDLVACALTRAPNELGVDVEEHRAVDYDLVERCLSPTERATLLSRPPRDRVAHWTTLWTLKEAHAKATGEGLRAPHTTTFDLASIGSPHVVDDARWHCFAWQPTPRHSAAICGRLRICSPAHLSVEWRCRPQTEG